MQILRRITAVLLLALVLALSAAPTPGSATPDQSSLDQVVKALKVSRQPSDYVIVVDTSGSMTQDNRYPKVKTAIRSLLEALKADDRVSLVTFDSKAEVRHRGAIGKDRLAALRSLPATPQGLLTDIGAGLAAGIGELEAANARDVGAIVLITDGKLDTAPDSAYRTVDAPAWAQLKSRADAVSARHKIASYAIALESSADAALLKKAFPKAEDIPAAAIDERLAELDSALVRFQARQLLEPDVGRGVQASWSGDLMHLTDAAGDAEAQVTLLSTFERIPVEVSGLSLDMTSGPSLGATHLPDTVVLKPGKSVTIPVKLSFKGRGSGQLVLSGDVSSPWQQVMTKSLGLTFAPKVEASVPVATFNTAPTPASSSPVVVPWAAVGLAAGVAALVALVLLWRTTRPRLVGSLAVSRGGVVVDEFILTGRSLPLNHGANAAQTALTGAVTPLVRPGRAKGENVTGVQVKAQVGKSKAKGSLLDGQSLTVGELKVTYTSARTRMMELISDGTPAGADDAS